MTETRANYRTARLVAVVAGLLGHRAGDADAVVAPVTQTTAQLNWPQNGVLNSVTAPLIGYVATDLDISVPWCRPPPASTGRPTVCCPPCPSRHPKAVDRGLLIQRAGNDLLVIVRNYPRSSSRR